MAFSRAPPPRRGRGGNITFSDSPHVQRPPLLLGAAHVRERPAAAGRLQLETEQLDPVSSGAATVAVAAGTGSHGQL